MKILLVEDNDVNVFLAQRIFQKTAPESVVLVTKNGEQALSLLESETVDLVFMDIYMPVMDGFEATIILRENPKFSNLPIIAMTSGVLESEKKQSFDVGMNDYLSKPIVETELADILSKWGTKD